MLTCCRVLLQLWAGSGRPHAIAVVAIHSRLLLLGHCLHLGAEDATGPSSAQSSHLWPLLLGHKVADGKGIAGWGWWLQGA